MRSVVLIVCALASMLSAPVAAAAQAVPQVNAVPVSAPALPYPAISATATATRDFVPDLARVSVTLDATAGTAVAALAAIHAKEQSARAAVAPAVVTVAGLALEYSRGSVKTGGPEVMVTETISTQVDVARVGAAVDALRRFGPTLGVGFDTTRREQLYRDALAEATSIAYGRAVAVAAAAKADVDRITFVDAGAGAQALALQDAVLGRLQAGALTSLTGLFGQPAPATITATAIVTVRLK